MDAHPEGKNTIFWTSLREVRIVRAAERGGFNDRFRQEPVLYIAGRPHVLRLVDKPLENVE